MGRYYFGKKDTVEDCLDVDVFWLKKNGYFCGFKSGGIKWSYRSGHESNISISIKTYDYEKYINFNYTITNRDGQKEDFDYKIPIVSTSCNLGGMRHWFTCTLYKDGVQCMRRVGKLYLPPGGKYFGCRNCYDLSYGSRQSSRDSKFSAFSKMFGYEAKMEKLHSAVGRKYYAGKLTKKYAKYLRTTEEFYSASPLLMQQIHSLTSGIRAKM